MVSWPWPWFLVPMRRVALPLGSKRISANSGCGRRRPLDGVGDAEAAQPAAPPRRLAPGGEARDVGELERLVHALLELAAVVGRRRARSVRHRRGRDEVLPPQLDRGPRPSSRAASSISRSMT